MSQPFNFNTPITENTALVARYRCGSAPYAGKWFRITTTDGKMYVPETLEEAEAASKIEVEYSSYYSLLNIETGVKETVYANTVEKIEFGGGWRSVTWDFFPMYYRSDPAASNVNRLRYISGYPEGLSSTKTILGIAVAYTDTISYSAAINIDMSGFKFNNDQWPGLTLDNTASSSYCPIFRLGRHWVNSSSYSNLSVKFTDGGGCLVLSSLYAQWRRLLMRIRIIPSLPFLFQVSLAQVKRILISLKGPVSVAHMLKDGWRGTHRLRPIKLVAPLISRNLVGRLA